MGNAFAKLLCVFSTLLRFRVHCEVRGKIIFATTLLIKKTENTYLVSMNNIIRFKKKYKISKITRNYHSNLMALRGIPSQNTDPVQSSFIGVLETVPKPPSVTHIYVHVGPFYVLYNEACASDGMMILHAHRC